MLIGHTVCFFLGQKHGGLTLRASRGQAASSIHHLLQYTGLALAIFQSHGVKSDALIEFPGQKREGYG